MGGNKDDAIQRVPLLHWYHEKFAKYLHSPNARPMIIGYSFGDRHINEALAKATRDAQLKLFIIDPNGLDFLKHPALHGLQNSCIGASRRSLLSRDYVENRKIMRFFEATDTSSMRA